MRDNSLPILRAKQNSPMKTFYPGGKVGSIYRFIWVEEDRGRGRVAVRFVLGGGGLLVG